MALVKAKGRQTSAISVESEGRDVYVRAMRDGSFINMPWLMAKAIEGKVFVSFAGKMTGETTFVAANTPAKPDVWVGVPSGTTIIPVYISIGFEDTGGTAAVMDVFAVASNVYDADTAGAAVSIANYRTDKPLGGSQCTSKTVVTSSGTDPESGNYVEFWRPMAGFSQDSHGSNIPPTNNQISGSIWAIGDAVVPPIIVGPGSLNVYCGTNAGKGFVMAAWVEEPSANLI